MATATIVKVWHDGVNARIAVAVSEGGNKGRMEYNATVPLADLNALANNAAKKQALIDAVKAARDATLPVETDLSAIASGNVTI